MSIVTVDTMTRKTETVAGSVPVGESPRPHASRVHTTWTAGDRAHQGDLILVALSAVPLGATPRDNRQMADGVSPGSRHVVEGGKVVDADKTAIRTAMKAFGLDVDETYIGPVMIGPCTLTHPTHAHQVFPADTVTAVVYQRNLDAEERAIRARD